MSSRGPEHQRDVEKACCCQHYGERGIGILCIARVYVWREISWRRVRKAVIDACGDGDMLR